MWVFTLSISPVGLQPDLAFVKKVWFIYDTISTPDTFQLCFTPNHKAWQTVAEPDKLLHL